MLPPELSNMFVSYFEADPDYFNDDAASGTELWRKVKPKHISGSTSTIVVKTFRTDENGTPITEGLPYELVPAEESFDMWAVGVSTVVPRGCSPRPFTTDL